MRILVKELRYARLDTSFVGTFKPYAHQLKTLEYVREAIKKRQTICIENTSVTGSGKTLANFAASLLDGVYTCGVYPTNELLFDQFVSLRHKFSSSELAILDSQGLDDIIEVETHMRSHAHALAWATEGSRHTAVLTNPDVLYLAMYSLYGQMFSSYNMSFGARVFRHILGNYPVIAFDEFHLYSAKQIANAAFMMGTAKALAPSKPHIFIFSSATPQPQFKQYVQRLGMEALNVTDELVDDGHVVCEPIEVTIFPADLLHWQGGDAIRANVDEILSWADSCTPSARGVFIVDSVYEAKRIAEELRQRYPAHDVGEVHGYMDPEARSDALQRRFSVGTTTIDVGVDLTEKKSKEFLVCEARSAAQAIQRIGRLGRHGREPDAIPIPNRIWLAVPEYVSHYMERIGDDTMVARERFNEVLSGAYLGYEKFFAYTREYSPLEAVAATERIKQQDFDDSKAQTEACLQRLITTLYDKEPPTTQEQAEKSYKKYRSKQWAIWSKFGTEIRNPSSTSSTKKKYYLSDLESFRGGMESDFTVALYDELDRRLALKPLKTYNLPFVLRRTQCEEMDKQSFEELIQRNHPMQAEEWLAHLNRQRNVLGYIHVRDLLHGQANEWYFEIDKAEIGYQFQRVIRLEGITIDGNALCLRRGQESINGRLKRRKLNCWMSEQRSFSLSQRFHLPPLFAIYPLHATNIGGTYSEWSIAFGLDAFLLESIAKKHRWTKSRSDNTAIIL